MHSFNYYLHIASIRVRAIKLVPLTPLLLAAIWLLTIYRGERSAFGSAVSACDWATWESWPTDARPHRALLIADPQLVDPHTYPGRPWPLSSLTERYTDRYMARSYRLINEQHDPDSIIFLGDMLDGGREWAPSSAKPLSNLQKWQLEKTSPSTTEVPTGAVRVEFNHPGWKRPSEVNAVEDATLLKREAQDTVAEAMIDLTAFVPGEHGRWQGYNNKQWESEYKRFGDIFLAPKQLYPSSSPQLVPYETVRQDAVNIENGAKNKLIHHYAFVGSKLRTVLASLPGNHDLGFGSGVQMPIRGRYKWHFGELNRVDILGNHTFVSIDALSLAAWSQFEENGRETAGRAADRRKHLYVPTQEFVDDIGSICSSATHRAMSAMFQGERSPNEHAHLDHHVLDTTDMSAPLLDERSDSLRPASHSGLPVILLTHVPLYREPDTSCGPKRERGRALSITGGYQYQNVLTRTLSEMLAFKLGAAGQLRHIFSGDDHDYCDVMHTYTTNLSGSDSTRKGAASSINVREETVKSFSWAMGVRRPGFHMVSLWNPVRSDGLPVREEEKSTIQTHLCLLPDQLGIFLHYATMAGLTLLILIIRAIIVAFRAAGDDAGDADERATPMLQSLLPIKLGNVTPPNKTPSKQRHRASSSGLKPMSNGHLGVQRSANARARSVSPGVGLLQSQTSPFSTPTRPLIEQAGYYGADASEDEESRVGDMKYLERDDSQAKWRRHKRPRGKLRRSVDELVLGLSIVAGISAPYYLVLISRG